jgi:putative peptide zinc metalloprotease protein
MAIVDVRLNVWEALAGRAPGRPAGPTDPGLWSAVAERINPARATPVLRRGIECSRLTSVRGVDYVMLRSPDHTSSCYLRLAPEEWALAQLMDGTRTVARLVAEFARISGRLAPEQVTRVVADLAGNRMLGELPVDAFERLDRHHRRRWPVRLGRGLLAAARGRRMVLANVDPLVTLLYRAGGRLLFRRDVAALLAALAVAGFVAFCWSWAGGTASAFLVDDSYLTGALVLLACNVFALACHELGHALATKHAGRRVPAAGFLVYFGIPSVFVDTTDAWMAGRRARIVTTVSGPATGLVLAGAAQLVALLVPASAPWMFKLSFAWYLNALFNLNPLLALDGYYLLMDWLEVPNLRARGIAWVHARLRRRPPRYRDLDREGRIVALYGLLTVVWLLVAANLAYRVYADRVAGLTIGLWRTGWPGRLLLAGVVALLSAPILYAMGGWVVKRWRAVRLWFAERATAADSPRRLRALGVTPLGTLPPAVLALLARNGRWVRPRTGQQLVFAGAAQAEVFVVVDGALEARRPGDPGGTIRERAATGAVVGLANALTGTPSALDWHTTGTTLLALPSAVIAAAVGPVTGPPPVERAELETLVGEVPALRGLSEDQRLGLIARARPVLLPPDAPVILAGASDAALVASGAVHSGHGQVGRGALLGPHGDTGPAVVGTTRTAARVWRLPAAGLPLFVRAPSVGAVAGVAPAAGAHPRVAYPPLAAPPEPPPVVAADTDRRFERKLWWLLLVLLLFATLLTGANLWSGPAWAEMPTDRVLLTVNRGAVVATVGRERFELRKGQQVYVGANDAVTVDDRANAQLTFHGGAVVVLCGGTAVRVGAVERGSGAIGLASGLVLAETKPETRAHAVLRLSVRVSAGTVHNSDGARFAVSPGGVRVARGTVLRDGVAVPVAPTGLSCGDGIGLPEPDGTATPPEEAPSSDPSREPSQEPSQAPTQGPGRAPSVTPQPTPNPPSRTPTRGPTTPGAPPTTTWVSPTPASPTTWVSPRPATPTTWVSPPPVTR